MGQTTFATQDHLNSVVEQIDEAKLSQLVIEGLTLYYPDDMGGEVAAADPDIPPSAGDASLDDEQNARLSALEASPVFLGRLPSSRVEALPSLTQADAGTVYYSENGNRHRPGLVMWDGRGWRRAKDGQFVHTNRRGI